MPLLNIFTPQSIAVIGASAQEGSVGNSILKNLLGGYKGQVFPVNPKSTEILNTPCFTSVSDLLIVPDLAVIVVPAKIVPIVMQQVADKGIKGVIIITAGFKEVGRKGIELEKKVKEICIANNISLIGPNCLGVINPWINMNASFATDIPPKGNIAFLSQSGAICTAVIDYAKSLDLGFSKFVSVGNKALCGEVEMLKYLEQDEQTDVIAVYAEGLTNANLIIETIKTITKPVVILKSGRTTAGSGASSSHTGALASEDVLFETLFRQAGMIRANTIEELFEYMQVLSKYKGSEKLKTKSEKLQVAIITNAGGPGVLTTDFVIQNGMELAKISKLSMAKLRSVLPPTANFNNPFDLIGDAPAQRYQDALEVICQDENVDAIIVILTPQTTTQIDETANYISNAVANCKKPIVASFIGGDRVLSGVKILRQNDVVHIDFPENAARALSVLNSEKVKMKNEKLREVNSNNRHFGHSKESSMVGENGLLVSSHSGTGSFATFKMTSSLNRNAQAQAIFDHYRAKNQYYIPEVDAKKIFECYNIPTVKSVFCKNAEEVKELVGKTFAKLTNSGIGSFTCRGEASFGKPEPTSRLLNMTNTLENKLILKIISPDVMHKSDVGGVTISVSIENAEEEFIKMMKLVQEYLPNAKLEGVLFSQMVDLSAGVEFILGAKKDPSLGTAIMFGLGGTMVELIHDVVFGFGKLQREDVLQMIECLSSKKIIEGYRGKSPLDLEAIISTIEGLSNLLSDFPEIAEVDMNPVLVSYNQSGVKVLDAKIVFE